MQNYQCLPFDDCDEDSWDDFSISIYADNVRSAASEFVERYPDEAGAEDCLEEDEVEILVKDAAGEVSLATVGIRRTITVTHVSAKPFPGPKKEA